MQDYQNFCEKFPGVERIMLGRGLVANPALAREIRGGAPLQPKELRRFHDTLFAQIRERPGGDKNALCRIKEQWNYWNTLFEGAEKPLKKLRKASRIEDYEAAVDAIFACPFTRSRSYHG